MTRRVPRRAERETTAKRAVRAARHRHVVNRRRQTHTRTRDRRAFIFNRSDRASAVCALVAAGWQRVRPFVVHRWREATRRFFWSLWAWRV